MSDDDSKLVYVPSNVVELATNTFIDVPVILQYDNTPIISTSKVEEAGYTVEFGIYHSDGTYLAKVVGPRLFATEDGKKAGVVMRHLPGVTACELAGKTLFEIRRTEAAALKTQAELYTPDGTFIRANDNGILPHLMGQQSLKIGERNKGGGYNKGTIGTAVIMSGATMDNTGTIGLAILLPGAAIEASGGKFTGPKVALLVLSGNVSYLDIPEFPKAMAEQHEPHRLGKMQVGNFVYDPKTGMIEMPERSPKN